MKTINWEIDRTGPETIQASFTRIAQDLFKSAIKVNNYHLRITEIEFYYWCPGHEDNTVHDHERLGGEWRMHNQGLDITLESDGDEKTGHNGGILIRGVFDGNTPIIESKKKPVQYVNGPRNVLFRLFERMGKVDATNSMQLIPNYFPQPTEIHRAKRHGLKPYNGDKKGQHKIGDTELNYPYRYFTDKEHFYNEAYWHEAEAGKLL